jgi:multiple sugar transport system permease protein
MINRLLLFLVLLAGAAISAFPFVYMFGTSFKSLQEAASPEFQLFPSVWHWENYGETFRAAPFGRYFANTFFVAIIVTGAVALTAIAGGYALARLKFPGAKLIFAMLLATMMVPFEVILVPNFVIIQKLGWYDSYLALIVPWCANGFSIFLMRQAFLGLPADYFDAGRVDGCGHLRFLAWVGTPLVKPMVITVALFAFLGSYNSLVWPLVVTGTDEMRLIQVGLTVFSGADGVKFHLLMAASAIVMSPTLALYFVAQRYFLEGSINAGIKG